MIRPDFRRTRYSIVLHDTGIELYHYGTKGKSGRYPLGSGERPYQDYPNKRIGKIRKKEGKIIKKYDKYDKVISKRQAVADKYYQKAIKKSNSRFSSKEATKKAYDKATDAQEKVNKLQYKGSQAYKKYEKKAKKLDITMNEEIRKRGQKYLEDVERNSRTAYQLALSRKMG